MEVLLLLLIISFLISGGFLIVYIISAKNGQFDDTYGPANKILFDQNTKKNNLLNQ